MTLEELVGKKAVRTKSLWFDTNNNLIDLDNDIYDKNDVGEDDSYTDNQYITVLEVTSNSIKYIQHFGGMNYQGEREFKFDDNYDKSFLDDNWKEYMS